MLRRCLILLCQMVLLGLPMAAMADGVVLKMEDDSLCVDKDGKLVVLVNASAEARTVWVDRWFMQVKTPDHTRHDLAPDERHALGCSNTRAGEQHWTFDEVK